MAPSPANRAINRDRVAITRNPSATLSAPATTAAAHFSHRMPDYRIRVPPRTTATSSVSASCMPTRTG